MTTITTECPYDCSFRIISYTPGLWECLKCHQIWDRPERGTRVWNTEQRAEHQELWAQALISGSYQQGTGGYLRRTAPHSGSILHSCTGVAVDICPFTQ